MSNQLTGILKLPLMATVLFLGACGQNGEVTVGNQGEGNRVDSGLADTITVYTWSEYLDPELLEAFEAETGVEVVYEVFNTAAEMEAKLKSRPGDYDVVIVDDSIVSQLDSLRLIRPLDSSKLANLENIDPKYRAMPFDPRNEFSAPYLWGTTLLAYRSDKIEAPAASWEALWDDRLKGRVMLLDEAVQLYSVMFNKMGESPDSMDPALYSAVTAEVDRLIREHGATLGGDEDVKEGLRSGEVWAAMCYSTDAAMLADEQDNIDYFIPKEGAPLWIDCFVVPRDSSKLREAHLFIDFMLRPESAVASTNYTWCATPNRAAIKDVDSEIVGDPRIFPPQEVIERCFFLPALDEARQRVTNVGWIEILRSVQQAGRPPGHDTETASATSDADEPDRVEPGP